MTTYFEKLKDPRWQKKRLKVLKRDQWTCQICNDTESTLNVHHRYYLENHDPWDYPMKAFVTLCNDCHKIEKENRYEQEKNLLHSLKKHFFAEDVEFLATYFDRAKLCHDSGVFVDVLGWILFDEKIQREIIGRYFEYLRSHGSKK